MESMSQSDFKQKEISQILLKPNFKVFWQSEEGFQRCGFLSPPLDFIPAKSPGLRELNKHTLCTFIIFSLICFLIF